ncbi:hypothetical protein LSTR_LSTR013150 [Laodelphax striatellus]|uniref:Uncharacterized protein n=1 Tax=Laodelphax striatellus TaxID=195883 RepID=A0A482XLA6_LAOST|nr:hypothetical protein LSTR_LSTR013150 [Laodelphax striatellus]
MSDEPPAGLFGSDSLTGSDDVIKGDESMEFSASEDSAKIASADFQKVMDSIAVTDDDVVDVDDDKLLSAFVSDLDKGAAGAVTGVGAVAGAETPEETMQVERLMESIHSGSTADEQKVGDALTE